MSLWLSRERYSGKTQEIIEAAISRCGTDANHPGVRILIAAMCWLSKPIEQRSKYWDQRCERLQRVPQGESSVVPIMGPGAYVLDDFMLVLVGNEYRLTPFPPDETCHHCHTREPQTGKSSCDVCGVNPR